MDIASWPDPTPGADLELVFLGQQHKCIIPITHQVQILEPKLRGFESSSVNFSTPPLAESRHGPNKLKEIEYQVLASNPTTYLSYILFGPNLLNPSTNQPLLSVSTLWMLWEILILAEPLVVYGSTPDIVSDTVLHLKNLIRPIPFHANWRPYITIHDPDFSILFSKNKARAVGLIGATNPIILTNTHSWPNVLSLTPQGGSINHQVGLVTDRKRMLQKNKQIVKVLQACLDRKDYHQADVVISQHFSLLTEQFLQPLQRYFLTLLPTKDSNLGPKRTGSFNEENFLKSLKLHTSTLEFRSRLLTSGITGSMVVGFYTSFMRSPNFSAWLHRQVDLANLSVRCRPLTRSPPLPLSTPSRPAPPIPPSSIPFSDFDDDGKKRSADRYKPRSHLEELINRIQPETDSSLNNSFTARGQSSHNYQRLKPPSDKPKDQLTNPSSSLGSSSSPRALKRLSIGRKKGGE